MRSILMYSDNGYEEYPLSSKQLLNNGVDIFEKDKQVYYMNQGVETKIQDFEFIHLGESRRAMLYENTSQQYRKNSRSVIVHPENGDFIIGDLEFAMESNCILNPKKIDFYINGVKYSNEKIQFEEGDQIHLVDLMFVVHEYSVRVSGNRKSYKTNLVELHESFDHIREFPSYRRSPRIIKRLKEERVNIVTPPESQKMSKGGLVKIIVPPLVSAGATLGMALVIPRGPYVFIGLVTTTMSLIFAITTYVSEKKEQKEKNAKRKEVYGVYLLKTRSKLEELSQMEAEAKEFHYPSVSEIAKQIKAYSSRIYEKDVNDDDFLQLYIGESKDKSLIDVTLDAKEFELESDELLDEARQIKKRYEYNLHKPTIVDLKKAHVGLVGDIEDIHAEIKKMLAQITFFQSYHDVEIVMLYNEAFQKEFDYTKWYPHLKISAINVSGNVYSEKIRDQVLGSLAQILKQRRDIRDERKREGSYSPHYIIFIDDYHLVMNHSIMEYLQEASVDLGFSMVFSAKQKADLPENIKTVILIEDREVSTLLLNEGEMVNKRIHTPNVIGVDYESMARDLSVLEHQKGMKSQIPEKITFFGLYDVESPQELQVRERWGKNQSHKSLAVPLGVRAEHDIVELNLHEKAHGPHGLVAGTTGSGKSEIIQSYILSLAVNFHPHEVGFLLIDYKGGGMASLFKNLPHLLGTITNLDGSESMRALASIKSELQRRQRIFNDHNVNNIIQYNKLFKAGNASEPLPSLFIISDEFAELKKEQPEFMSELVSAARIGRSLGVKLILATQKPSGVVDDQIWSNSKFKLALKVQNEGDSKEVIKTADAAYITQPGRSYLQVGNNEIYELFQSAWSGAVYSQGEEDTETDNLVYRINDIGQSELINKDLSEEDESKGVSATQLDVTVDYVAEIYEGLHAVEVTKPWLPSLEKQILSPHIQTDNVDVSMIDKLDLICALGVVDIPEQQEQKDFEVDFMNEGNLAIFSSSGYGKSFTLGTIMLSLAVKNNPKLLNYYIVDLGNSALIPYSNLPHTADYMTFDSEEKLGKFMKLINDLIKERKQLFAKAMVQNFDTYNQMDENKKLKAVIIFVDNYDVVKEMKLDFEDFILKVSRDGAGLGIYFVITATRNNAVRFATLNNFRNKIAHYMFDPTEISGIVGRSQYQLPEIKGRSLVKLASVNMMQVYTPLLFETGMEYTIGIKEVIQKIKDQFTGTILKGIPVLPNSFTSNEFNQYEKEANVSIMAGLCVQDVSIVDANIVSSPYVIVGPQSSGKTNLLELYLVQMMQKGKTYLFDSDTMYFYKYKQKDNLLAYIENEDDMKEFIESMYAEVSDRKEKFQIQMTQSAVSPKEFYAALPSFNIFIDDIDLFIAKVDKKYDGFLELLKEACSVGIGVIASTPAAKLKGYDEFTKFFKTTTNGMILVNQGTHSIFPVGSTREYPVFGQGLLFNNGGYRRIQIPKYTKIGGENNDE